MRYYGDEFEQDIAVIGKRQLTSVDSAAGWWPLVREPYMGAWQMNRELTEEIKLAFHAVYACVTLIAGDIAKLRFKLVAKESGIWREVENPAYSPLLRKPNSYQTHIQFREYWIVSKITRGNVYALKERDNRGVVVRLHILDPHRVMPLISDTGDVFYRLYRDYLAGVDADENVIVPAREIIHDRMNCLFHPLVGIPPLYAAGMAAAEGLAIQRSQSSFFGNQSLPSGILTTPGNMDVDKAREMRELWNENYSGANAGKVAFIGNDFKFQQLAVTATDAQLIEQLKMTAEIVCSVFHVPAWMVGLGETPSYNNVQAIYLAYYNQALQILIESMEACLDEGLGLDGRTIGVELDIDSLLRMDTATRYKTWSEAIGGGWFAPNEARRREDLEAKDGGDSPYLQQQNFSLAALAARDRENPLGTPRPPAQPTPPEPAEKNPEPEERGLSYADANRLKAMILTRLREVAC